MWRIVLAIAGSLIAIAGVVWTLQGLWLHHGQRDDRRHALGHWSGR